MKIKLTVLFLVAFIFRIALIPVAHHGDLNNNISWGEELLNRGVVGFYGSEKAEDWPYSAPNQPPLYIFLFGGVIQTYRSVDALSRFLNESVGVFPSSFVWYWEEQGMDLVAKLPSILADLGIGYLIYLYFQKSKIKNQKSTKALLLAFIWLFNPLTWYNSAIWGQTDPIVNFLGIIAVLGLLGVFEITKRFGKLQWFSFWFTIAFLFKPSLSIFIPVLFLFVIKQRFNRKEWIQSVVISFVTIIITSFWFNPHLNFFEWIVNLYLNRILPGEIGYLTANAFNLWWLVDSGKVLDSTVYWGISARVWGLITGIAGIGSISLWFISNYRDSRASIQKVMLVLLSLSLSALIAFLFLTRIHERYLYPFFPYATLLLGLFPKFWTPYVLLSATYLLNMYHLFWAPPISLLESHLTSWGWILSVVNIVTFFYLLRHLRSSNI